MHENFLEQLARSQDLCTFSPYAPRHIVEDVDVSVMHAPAMRTSWSPY